MIDSVIVFSTNFLNIDPNKVEKRLKWERLWQDYVSKFALVMPLTLPKVAAQMS